MWKIFIFERTKSNFFGFCRFAYKKSGYELNDRKQDQKAAENTLYRLAFDISAHIRKRRGEGCGGQYDIKYIAEVYQPFPYMKEQRRRRHRYKTYKVHRLRPDLPHTEKQCEQRYQDSSAAHAHAARYARRRARDKQKNVLTRCEIFW